MAFNVSAFGLDEAYLPKGWMAERLDTLVSFNPDQINGDYPYSEIAYLDIANVEAGMIGKPTKLSLADAPSRAKRIVRQNDTILSTVRPGNRAYAFLREAPENLVVSTGFAVIRARESVADPRFVYCLVTNDPIINYLASIAEEKTAYPSVNPRDIAECVVPIPPLSEQRAIAHILGTLDDKIELNRKMNETLEAMARALFKSWFVDFDPVRAKAEGRPTGLPKHIADLFADSFVDSELGEIPKGWNVKKLSDLCLTQYGYTASAVDKAIGPKFLRVTDINKRNWIEWEDVPHCSIDEAALAAYALKIGDIVVARMADPGKSAIIEEQVDAVFASYLVRLKTGSLAQSYFVYGFLKSDLYMEYAEGVKSGSVQANMNAKIIVGASLVVPPATVMEKFLGVILPLRQRLVANVRESRSLAALRDTLLPKLISGELRVKDAEVFVGRNAC